MVRDQDLHPYKSLYGILTEMLSSRDCLTRNRNEAWTEGVSDLDLARRNSAV